MVKRYIEGGYGLSEMEEDEQGDWVSYEDYEALRQKLHAVAPPQDDGWIEWGGGEQPVDDDAIVEIRCRHEDYKYKPERACHFAWNYTGHGLDIIAYRVVS